jgi:hypothetical protein
MEAETSADGVVVLAVPKRRLHLFSEKKKQHHTAHIQRNTHRHGRRQITVPVISTGS